MLAPPEDPPTMADIAEEFAHAQLGNVSRTRRLCWLVELMSRAPDRSFPKAAGDDGDLEGIYRFLHSRHVTYDAMLQSHYIQTADRMAGASRVLVLHDTTDGAYGGQRKGLGRLAGSLPGFLAHVSLAVAGDGTLRPLGALNVYCWARTNEPKSKKSKNGRKLSGADYAKREDKESERWMEAVRLCRERADAHQLVLHIADREGDNFVFLATMSVAGDRFVVRLAHNRAVGAEVVAGEQDLLRDVLEVAPVRAVRQVTLSRRLGNAAPGSQATHQPREQREVTLEIRATTVALQRPRYVDASLPRYLPVHVVYVTEVNAPADVEPVEWMLVTSEPIDTVEEILQVVDDYRARWLIEEFFKALKTGCALEKRQLESIEALTNALALFVPIAWQLLLLRNLSRSEPDAPATTVLTPTQIEVLTHFVPKAKLPEHPTVREVLFAVARLGGHIKNNGDPGWLVLGRGLIDLLQMERAWLAALDVAQRRRSDGTKLDQS